MFDFNGDGEAEVVYRDECWLRVFSGRSGKSCLQHRLHREPCWICRVIADVDGMVTPELSLHRMPVKRCVSNRKMENRARNPAPGATSGIRVLEDPKTAGRRQATVESAFLSHHQHPRQPADSAAGNRKLESPQHVPAEPATEQSRKESQPDSTGRIEFPPDVGDCATLLRLSGVVCKPRCADDSQRIPIDVYLGDPRLRSARSLCTADTDRPSLRAIVLWCLVNGKIRFAAV